MVEHLRKHVSITGVRRPQQVRSIEQFLRNSPWHSVIEVDVEPLLRFNPETDTLQVDWPIAPQIGAILIQQQGRASSRVYYELTFSNNAINHGTFKKACQLVRSRQISKQVSGVTWKGRPLITDIIDTRIAAPWIRQSLRLTESELEMAYHKESKFIAFLLKWQQAGVDNIILPLQHVQTDLEVQYVLRAVGHINSHTRLGVRLESGPALVRRIVLRLIKRLSLTVPVSFGMHIDSAQEIAQSIKKQSQGRIVH